MHTLYTARRVCCACSSLHHLLGQLGHAPVANFGCSIPGAGAGAVGAGQGRGCVCGSHMSGLL